MTRIMTVALATILLTACTPQDAADTSKPDLAADAERIAKSSIIVDGHIDVPYRHYQTTTDVGASIEEGEFDHPRAIAGGLNAPFMSIYTAADLEASGESKALAENLIDMVNGIVESAPDKFAIALSPADVRAHFDAGIISLPLGMENGSPLESDLANLQHFFDRGIRYITLAHSKSNIISDSSYDPDKRWGGLSDFGKEVVPEMNRLGIMVDISHVSDDAFWDVLEISKVPVIASHSSVRHFTPGFERNMNDDMIKALGETGGVIMINYGSSFLTEEANVYSMTRWAESDAWKEQHPDIPDDEADEQFNALFAEANGPYPFADISDVLDHIDRAVSLAGVDHVGIGSDYDGVGDSLPTGLKDVTTYPNLVQGLLERGYSEDDIRKILGENLLRVWEAVEAYAATTSDST